MDTSRFYDGFTRGTGTGVCACASPRQRRVHLPTDQSGWRRNPDHVEVQGQWYVTIVTISLWYKGATGCTPLEIFFSLFKNFPCESSRPTVCCYSYYIYRIWGLGGVRGVPPIFSIFSCSFGDLSNGQLLYIYIGGSKGAWGCTPPRGKFFSGSIFHLEVQDQRSVTMVTISTRSKGASEVDAPFRVIFFEKKIFYHSYHIYV